MSRAWRSTSIAASRRFPFSELRRPEPPGAPLSALLLGGDGALQEPPHVLAPLVELEDLPADDADLRHLRVRAEALQRDLVLPQRLLLLPLLDEHVAQVHVADV